MDSLKLTDFEEYCKLAALNAESADDWLILKLKPDTDLFNLGFIGRMKLLNTIKVGSRYLPEDPYEFEFRVEDSIINFIDPPGNYLYFLQTRIKKEGSAKAILGAIKQYYQIDGIPLGDCAESVSWGVAESAFNHFLRVTMQDPA